MFFGEGSDKNPFTLIKCSRNEEDNLRVYSVDVNKNTSTLTYTNSKINNEYFNCLSLNPADFTFFCSGDTEGNIQIFKLPNEETLPDNKKKKRRIEAQNIETQTRIEKCHGLNEIKNINWINNQQILTSGDDFLIKLWNIHTKTNYSVFNTGYKLTTAMCPVRGDKFLSGHEDGTIKLWDARVNHNNSNTTSQIIFKNAHLNYISDIVTNPNHSQYSNNFASSGYDGRLKLWDIRANKTAIYDIRTDSNKNYSVAYNSEKYLMTGGDNSAISIYDMA